MKNGELARQWLRRARSNLARARSGRTSREVVYEDLAFDCQQAIEKSLKALLIYHHVQSPRTHSINLLIDCLEGIGAVMPEHLKEAAGLTEFAVETRYPGGYEPVTRREYQRALRLAEAVVEWVVSRMRRVKASNDNVVPGKQKSRAHR